MIRIRAFASIVVTSFALLAACGGSPTPDPATPPAAPPADAPPPAAERREMSPEDCAAKGGNVVGDIGDGAVHKPEYRCPSGSPPIGRIPLGVEGSVCCT